MTSKIPSTTGPVMPPSTTHFSVSVYLLFYGILYAAIIILGYILAIFLILKIKKYVLIRGLFIALATLALAIAGYWWYMMFFFKFRYSL